MGVVPKQSNVHFGIALLHGLVCEELERDELECHDPDYEVTIGVKVTKAPESRFL